MDHVLDRKECRDPAVKTVPTRRSAIPAVWMDIMDDGKSRLVPSPPLGWVRSQHGRKQLVPTLPLPPAAPPGQQRTVVLSWGSNTAGQLGLGDFLTRVMPAPVDSLAQTTVLSLVCGSRTTLALDREGRVFAWGKGDDGQVADRHSNPRRNDLQIG